MPRLVKIVLIFVAGVVGLYGAASLAVGGLTSVRIQGNEAMAMGSVRAIQSAQAAFAAAECRGLYAPRLTVLAANGYLAPDLAAEDVVEKMGYRIALRASDAAPDGSDPSPACAGAAPSFVVTAEPVEPGQSGRRYFRANQKGEFVEATSSDFSDAKPVF